MTTIIAIAAFIAVAIVGWFIAEAKGKFVTYKNNDQEDAVLKQNRCQLEQNGYEELNIKDVMRTIATTGYSAV
jgi:chorismate mutase